jgi:hypothetical protein
LVKKGVTPADENRALELLLQKEIGGTDNEGKLEASWWLKSILLTIISILIFLSLRASTVFEIGKGKARARLQQWYDGFLRKTIPAFLIMGVVASALGNMVYEYFRGP